VLSASNVVLFVCFLGEQHYKRCNCLHSELTTRVGSDEYYCEGVLLERCLFSGPFFHVVLDLSLGLDKGETGREVLAHYIHYIIVVIYSASVPVRLLLCSGARSSFCLCRVFQGGLPIRHRGGHRIANPNPFQSPQCRFACQSPYLLLLLNGLH
jgi:hypothetical protein